MDIQHDNCAGLDVHKRTVVTFARVARDKDIRSFGTTTPDLLQLRDSLRFKRTSYLVSITPFRFLTNQSETIKNWEPERPVT